VDDLDRRRAIQGPERRQRPLCRLLARRRGTAACAGFLSAPVGGRHDDAAGVEQKTDLHCPESQGQQGHEDQEELDLRLAGVYLPATDTSQWNGPLSTHV